MRSRAQRKCAAAHLIVLGGIAGQRGDGCVPKPLPPESIDDQLVTLYKGACCLPVAPMTAQLALLHQHVPPNVWFTLTRAHSGVKSMAHSMEMGGGISSVPR